MKTSYKFLKSTAFIGVASLMALTLSGCMLLQNSNQSQANIKLQAAKYLNPDINGKASPVVVTIYELKTPFAFKQASYQELAANSGKVLGTNLVDKQIVELRPSQYQEVSEPVSQNTHFIGFVAAYRNIDQATWHSLVKVSPSEKHTNIKVYLESQGISAKVV